MSRCGSACNNSAGLNSCGVCSKDSSGNTATHNRYAPRAASGGESVAHEHQRSKATQALATKPRYGCRADSHDEAAGLRLYHAFRSQKKHATETCTARNDTESDSATKLQALFPSSKVLRSSIMNVARLHALRSKIMPTCKDLKLTHCMFAVSRARLLCVNT